MLNACLQSRWGLYSMAEHARPTFYVYMPCTCRMRVHSHSCAVHVWSGSKILTAQIVCRWSWPSISWRRCRDQYQQCICAYADGEALGQMLADLSTLYKKQHVPIRQESRLGMQQYIGRAAGLLSEDASHSGVCQMWHECIIQLLCARRITVWGLLLLWTLLVLVQPTCWSGLA